MGTDGKASVTVDPVAGIYKVTASYSGSKIFLPASYDPATPLFYTKGVSAGSSYVDVKDSYVYGEAFNFEKYTVAADGSVTKSTLAPSAISWTLPSGAGTDVAPRFSAGRAGWVGTAKFSDGGKTYSVNIVPRAIAVVGLTDYTFAQNDGSARDLWSMISFSGLVDDWAETDGFVKNKNGIYLALNLVISNSAGTEYTNSYPPAPGAYTARFEKDSSQGSNVNYTLSCPTVKLTITGQTYPITVGIHSLNDPTMGSVCVAYPENATSAAVGQTVIFQATPNPGYSVARWWRCTNDGTSFIVIDDSEGLETLTMAQIKGEKGQGLHVRVEFEKKNSTLTVGALPDGNAGTVTTDNKYFTNGKAFNPGAEITFTAVAKDGWHFAAWEYYVSGQPVVYGYEKTYTVTMPDASVELYARFERDT